MKTLILSVILWLQNSWLQSGNCGVIVSINLISYANKHGLKNNGECCDSGPTCQSNPCDPEITGCVTSKNNCDIGRFFTKQYTDQNYILFDTDLNFNQKNPLTYNFQSNWTGRLNLEINIEDTDSSSKKELIDNFHVHERNLYLFSNQTISKPSLHQLLGNVSNLNLTVVAYCDSFFYGPECDKYCKTNENSQYICDQFGNKICSPNWFGNECAIFCVPKNNTRDGHFICDNNGGKVCYKNWYGINCTKYCLKTTNSLTSYLCDNNGEKLCSQYWYGRECNVFCKPEASIKGHYTCNLNNGEKICSKNWFGKGCNKYCQETSNSNYVCNSFTGDKRCFDNYYGKNCDVYCREEINSNYTCNKLGIKVCHQHYYGKNCSIYVPSLPTTDAVCVISGQSFIKSFDEHYFTFPGDCNYQLAADCIDDSFAIHFIAAQNCPADACKHSVKVYIEDTIFTLNGKHVLMDAYSVVVPSRHKGVLIEALGDYVSLSWKGLNIKWEGNSLYIELSPLYANRTCGLCGNFNGNPLDDQINSIGNIDESVPIFIKSWKRLGIGETCGKSATQSFYNINAYNNDKTVKSFNQLNSIEQKRVMQTCNVIKSRDFLACHATVPIDYYYKQCLKDVSRCSPGEANNCSCNALAEYSRECSRKHVTLNWRKPYLCAVTCPNGMIHSECASTCRLTCQNIHQRFVCPKSQCIDGCFCPDGTVKFQNKCISKVLCPCSHNKQVYNNGDVIKKNCNKCVCSSGRWNCTKNDCPATCSTFGDPHYKTFDGKWYDFNGICEYLLVEDYVTNLFKVISKNVACNAASKVSCAKSVVVVINNTQIELKRGMKAFVNTQPVTLPYISKGVAVKKASSIFLRVSTSIGLEVLFDGYSSIYITIQPNFIKKTQGLCGTYNSNIKDDFQTADGSIALNSLAFGNAWRMKTQCKVFQEQRHPCKMQSQKNNVAEKKCNKLMLSPFSACHNTVNPDPYIQSCRFDVCGCKDSLKCLCDAVAAYSRECADQGVIINWRNDDVIPECAIQCPVGHEYQECRETCASSCQDLSSDFACHNKCVAGCNCPNGTLSNEFGSCVPITRCSCLLEGNSYPAGYVIFKDKCLRCICLNGRFECNTDKSCGNLKCPGNQVWSNSGAECLKTCEILHVPCVNQFSTAGCICPNDTVWDSVSQKCIDAINCSCFYNGRTYKNGEAYKWDCNTCTCNSNKWTCTANNCPGTCSVYGDPHYTTFDGKRFMFEGLCSYTLVEDFCEDSLGSFKIEVSNEACGNSGSSCTKSITFTVHDTEFVMAKNRPILTSSTGQTMIDAVFTVVKTHFYDIVHTSNGVTLTWDRGSQLWITLNPKYKGKVCGLCGNFNDDQNDDFTTPELDVVVKPESFGDSWKIGSCPDAKLNVHPCKVHKDRVPWANKQCNIINRNLFKPCHEVVDPMPYFDACYHDACGCDAGGECDCLCTAVAAYAEACNMQGVHIKWRTQEFCPIQCELCQEYKACGPSNPKTCKNLCATPVQFTI